MQKQVHVIYRGRVQGVGFRFSARSLAENLDVSGCVTNLPDGTVEVIAEQDEQVLDDFLRRLEQEFSGYIASRQINWTPATKSFRSFDIQ